MTYPWIADPNAPLRLDLEPPTSQPPTTALAIAADALHELQDVASFLARDERDNAVARAENVVARLAEMLHVLGTELTEILPQYTCADCNESVIEYRAMPSKADPTKREKVCVECARDRIDVTRGAILDRAKAIVQGREASYGDPTPSFQRAAMMWSALLGAPVSAAQFATCMIALKLARLAESPAHLDSWIDAAGYAGLGGEVASR